jgi:hypothetical protein
VRTLRLHESSLTTSCRRCIIYHDSFIHRVPLALCARQPSRNSTAEIPENPRIHASSLHSCHPHAARNCFLHRYLVPCAQLLPSLHAPYSHLFSGQLPHGDLLVGFSRDSQVSTWAFFTSFTLALLMAYQAIVFCLTFYRLIRALINQRHIENTSRDSSHLIRGTGWIAGGLKLGAIETLVGFVQIGFGITLTRRILRFLSRAFLIIGVIKG